MIRGVRMCSRIPVRDLVLAVVARVWDHTIDMLPGVAQFHLQRQFSINIDKAHWLVRSLLLDAWPQQESRCRSEVAKADVRQIWAFRQVNLQQHMDRRARGVDGHAAHNPALQARYLIPY